MRFVRRAAQLPSLGPIQCSTIESRSLQRARVPDQALNVAADLGGNIRFERSGVGVASDAD